MRRLDSVELMDYIKVYENSNISMSLLLTDNSSIINSIQRNTRLACELKY